MNDILTINNYMSTMSSKNHWTNAY